MSVRRSVDVPGQLGPMEHARIIARRRPKAVVVILDISSPPQGRSSDATAKWLTDFCRHLNAALKTSPALKKALRALIFVGNKADKVKENVASIRSQSLERIVRMHLTEFYGPEVTAIPIMPCVLVENEAGTKHADAVIVRLAKSMV